MTDLDRKLRVAESIHPPELWQQVEARAESLPPGGTALGEHRTSNARQRVLTGLLAFTVFSGAAVLLWKGFYPAAGPLGQQTHAASHLYEDPAGWSVQVPPRWHVLTFSAASQGSKATGAMFSTVSLPAPVMTRQTPIQATGEGLPMDAIALVVAESSGPALPSGPRPPLSIDQFSQGSAIAGSPTLETLMFQAHGQAFIATIKAGPNVSSSSREVVAAMIASFESPTPSPSIESGDAIAIDGVPFKVCRPMTIPGDFGGGLDTAWVFEEERVPGAGCIGSEGFQRLGIGSTSQVQLLSDRITDLVGDDAYRVWPYATLDLDGDGVDEIAVAKQGDPGTSRTIWFFQIVAHDKLIPVSQGCGPACDPAPFSTTIGSVLNGNGTSTQSGMYCEGQGASQLVIEWSVTSEDPLLVSETKRGFADGVLDVVSRRSYRVASVDQYPPSGFGDLCGNATQEP